MWVHTRGEHRHAHVEINSEPLYDDRSRPNSDEERWARRLKQSETEAQGDAGRKIGIRTKDARLYAPLCPFGIKAKCLIGRGGAQPGVVDVRRELGIRGTVLPKSRQPKACLCRSIA